MHSRPGQRRHRLRLPLAELHLYRDIWLTGYISHEEIRHKASHVPEGSHVFQYNETRTKNLAVPVAELHSLRELLEKIKAWESQH
jgi:hypothetical protein